MLWRYSRLLCISSLIVLLVFDSEAIHSLLKQQKSLLYLEENNDKAEPEENIFEVEESYEDSSETFFRQGRVLFGFCR